MLFHLTENVKSAFGTNWDPWLVRDGYLGVDIFFILSGFILTHVYYEAFRPFNRREYWRFLTIRLARIYPLHLFALGVLLLLVCLPGFVQRYPPSFFQASGFILSALLLQNWTPQAVMWNGPAWSLSAEWAAYLVFPLLLTLIRSVRTRAGALMGAAISLMLLAGIFIAQDRAMDAVGPKAGLLRLIFEFTAGCFLCRAYREGLPQNFPWGITDGLALAALAACFSWPALAPLSVLPFGYLILSLAQHDGSLQWLTSRKLIVFLGEISFSLYLMHWILIQISEWFASWLGRSFAQTASVLLLPEMLLVAIVTWHFVEKPARGLGRAIADKWRV